MTEPRIQLDEDGTLDDFHVTNAAIVHFEAIDESAWYAVIKLYDGQVFQLNFGARNRRAKGYAFVEKVDE